jgi:hypothetical protein
MESAGIDLDKTLTANQLFKKYKEEKKILKKLWKIWNCQNK